MFSQVSPFATQVKMSTTNGAKLKIDTRGGCLPEWRDLDSEHVQPVIEVLADRPARPARAAVGSGGRNLPSAARQGYHSRWLLRRAREQHVRERRTNLRVLLSAAQAIPLMMVAAGVTHRRGRAIRWRARKRPGGGRSARAPVALHGARSGEAR